MIIYHSPKNESKGPEGKSSSMNTNTEKTESITRIDIGLLTCGEFPETQSDYWPLRNELTNRGYRVEAIVWNDEEAKTKKADNLLFCSVWDYHQNYAFFRDWLDKTETTTNIINPPRVIRWNIDKSYLKHFQNNGIPVIETIWVDKDANPGAIKEMEIPWSDLIIKPSVGAGSLGMKRFDITKNREEALHHAENLTRNSSVMLQPYLESADLEGETALIYFGGNFSHAIHRPLAGHHAEPDEEVAEASPAKPEPDHLRIGEEVLKCMPFTPVYMRLDLLRGKENQALVLEVEMVEPSLFLGCNPGSEVSYADALEEQIKSVRRN